MHPLDNLPLYAGLTSLDMKDGSVDFGDGAVLSRTSAKFLTPLTLVNTAPKSPDPLNLRPEFWQMAAQERLITAQIAIAREAGESFQDRFEIARFLVLMLRLYSDPAIGLTVISSHPFESLCELPDDERSIVLPVETQPRYFQLATRDTTHVLPSLDWVRQNWKVALNLYKGSAEFQLAADSLDSGQFVPNHALALVSLWGALEAIFSPSTTELRFRVSALIAAYLEPMGSKRLELQKATATLYDMRSAAAHGKPKHDADHLLKTFELVRRVLIRMIHLKSVPSRELLERRLFGVE